MATKEEIAQNNVFNSYLIIDPSFKGSFQFFSGMFSETTLKLSRKKTQKISINIGLITRKVEYTMEKGEIIIACFEQNLLLTQCVFKIQRLKRFQKVSIYVSQ